MSIQNKEIAELFRKEKIVWDNKDINGIINVLEGSCGFGYRTIKWRDSSTATDPQLLKQWLDDIEYLRHIDTVLNTWSENDIGLAWGFYTEEFKHKEQLPEKVRVRFTSTYKREDEKWHLLMFHREIQPFTKEGFYPKELTMME